MLEVVKKSFAIPNGRMISTLINVVVVAYCPLYLACTSNMVVCHTL